MQYEDKISYRLVVWVKGIIACDIFSKCLKTKNTKPKPNLSMEREYPNQHSSQVL